MVAAIDLHDPNLLANYREDVRDDALAWQDELKRVHALGRGRVAELHAIAQRRGVGKTTAVRKYYEWKRGGLPALVDKAREPKARADAEDFLIGEDFWEEWRRRCEKHQRASVTAYRELIAEIREGKRIEGLPERLPIDKRTGLPRGLSYTNLMRHRPDDFELTAARIGRSAAANERPLVLTTRKGLYVGSHYMFDDIWHDNFVNELRRRKAGRPLEFHGLDLFSACKIGWGLMVRLENEVTGVMEGLNESMMRRLVAHVMWDTGYSPRGTCMVVEHGTAALGEDLARDLHDWTRGLVTVNRSGMEGAAAMDAQYAGRAKGNFRFKAALESLGNLIHNELDSLPGQTGKDVAHRPEGLHGLLKRNDALLNALASLPKEMGDLLKFPLVEFNQFREICDRVYHTINNRHVHKLEGWVECGHVTQELRLGQQLLTQADYLALPAPARVAIDAAVMADPSLAQPRLLSPWEVYSRGRGDLIRMNGAAVAGMLSRDLAKERTVRSHVIEFEDAEIGPGLHTYEAAIINAEGQKQWLKDGETYECIVNPFAPKTLFVRDAQRRFLGFAIRTQRVCRGDVEAVHRAIGAASKNEAELLRGLRQRHAGDAAAKADAMRDNATVLDQALGGPEERKLDKERASLARDAFARAAELSDTDKQAFLSQEEEPATPPVIGATGSANTAAQKQTLADYL